MSRLLFMPRAIAAFCGAAFFASEVLLPALSQDAGINLPPSQGDSGTGCFLPGVYNYTYTMADVAALKSWGFSSIRLPFNIATANDPDSLAKLVSYIDAIGGSGVLCMFGTANSSTDTHGTGIVDDVGAAIDAWSKVHLVFAKYPDVKYEIFNEPQGYSSQYQPQVYSSRYAPENFSMSLRDPAAYYATMLQIIKGAGLPEQRCIIAATGWEQFPAPLVKLGWQGNIGYHFYPWWLPEGNRTEAAYSALLQSDTMGISSRTYITEFGGNLNLPNLNYEEPDPSASGAGDVNCLRGMNDAVATLRRKGSGIKGAFHWHGWNNGDSYDFWAPANRNGSAKVRKILSDAFTEAASVTVV